MEESSNELPSSNLGTKAYWDETYEKEYDNFKDTKDIGSVWFGEDSVERLVDWMMDSDLVSQSSKILDLGCGNGYTLVRLAEEFSDLSGVDYSPAAISLAKGLGEDHDVAMNLEVGDILKDLPSKEVNSVLSQMYEVCLDKGTYDAVSLNPENPVPCRKRYISNVRKLLGDSGILVLTSCNWTENELLAQFKEQFKCVDKITAPTFQFGGVTGSRETVLVFKAV